MWIYTGNKLAKFHGKILSLSENIAKSFRGGRLLFFDSHCISWAYNIIWYIVSYNWTFLTRLKISGNSKFPRVNYPPKTRLELNNCARDCLVILTKRFLRLVVFDWSDWLDGWLSDSSANTKYRRSWPSYARLLRYETFFRAHFWPPLSAIAINSLGDTTILNDSFPLSRRRCRRQSSERRVGIYACVPTLRRIRYIAVRPASPGAISHPSLAS